MKETDPSMGTKYVELKGNKSFAIHGWFECDREKWGEIKNEFRIPKQLAKI
jgi:hypothetical protein